MDDADRAQIVVERAMERYTPPGHHAAVLHTHCTVCGENIEQARIQAVQGAMRCMECQRDWERYG